MTRRAIFAVGALLLAARLPAAEEPQPSGDVLTLDDAVALALQNNRRLGIAPGSGEVLAVLYVPTTACATPLARSTAPGS